MIAYLSVLPEGQAAPDPCLHPEVFVKKMGSLKRAFRWFDTRRIGKIAQVVPCIR